MDGLRLDVAVADRPVEFLCTFEGSGTIRGSSQREVVVVMNHSDEFDDAVAEAAPTLGSVEIQLD